MFCVQLELGLGPDSATDADACVGTYRALELYLDWAGLDLASRAG